jgi:HPt (histidine-containing phosphotransfer) domain-containing protein
MLISRSRPLNSIAPSDLPGASAAGGSGAAEPWRGAGADPLGANAAADPAGLDDAALSRLAELDPTGANRLLERVLKTFQTSAARLMPQLDVAHRAGDRDVVRLVAHTLKSSSASIGALALSQCCAKLETTILVDPAQVLDGDIAALSRALDAALLAIERRLAEHRA